jgi:hypothetical protein
VEPYATLGIIEVRHLDIETLLVHFTDGTFAHFSAHQLNRITPIRDLADGDNAEPDQ